MKALFFAMYATEWNICWSGSYDVMGVAVHKLKEYHIQQMEELKKAASNTLNPLMRSLVEGDKLMDGLQSATTDDELIPSTKKKVTETDEELQSRSDDVREKSLNTNADLDAIYILRLEADFVLKSEILFGTDVVRRNPTNVKNYETLLASLQRFETVINQLRDETKRISDDRYLEDIARMEISRSKNETSSANDS